MSTPPNSELAGLAASAQRQAPTQSSSDHAATTEDSAGFRELAAELMAFVGAFERWSDRKAAEAGASVPRMKLLNAIHCHGPQKMADLAGRLDTTPRNVTAIVDGLEAEGLVRRTPHPTDRRVTLVELTCSRENVTAQFGSYQRSIVDLFADLDETERQTLLRLMADLRTKMRPSAADRRASDD